MIIGFSEKTSKIIPKIFCKKFRHCAVLIQQKTTGKEQKYLLLNPSIRKIDIFLLKSRDLKILENNDWVFIQVKHKQENISTLCHIKYSLTCVGFTKQALGIKNPWILTPDQLYKYFKKMS
ncbi:MAG TPA: hypothetical protein PKJ33_03715 [Alphaproteobacteria bacterium]|nr:hypothetical protein [Alphaproteobacteria bacterium]